MMQKFTFRQGWIPIIIMLTLCASSSPARTIVLDASTADRMAAIHQQAPRLSWAGTSPRAGQFDTSRVDLTTESRFLIHFDLSRIPPGQRITNAELSVPVTEFSGTSPRLSLWRTSAVWGAGVCYPFRRTRPELTPWTIAGAGGAGTDRALNPTAVLRLIQPGVQSINVTADVALWYLKAAPDQGWMLGVEDAGVMVRLPSPVWDGAAQWKLLITYEPE